MPCILDSRRDCAVQSIGMYTGVKTKKISRHSRCFEELCSIREHPLGLLGPFLRCQAVFSTFGPRSSLSLTLVSRGRTSPNSPPASRQGFDLLLPACQQAISLFH